MLTTFLLVVHSLLALALVTVILLQKSEGGGFTGGSSSGNLVSARGAGDLLSRTTAILATLFIITSLTLAWLAGHSNRAQSIDTSLAKSAPAAAPAVPAAPARPGTPPPTLPATSDDVPVAN